MSPEQMEQMRDMEVEKANRLYRLEALVRCAERYGAARERWMRYGEGPAHRDLMEQEKARLDEAMEVEKAQLDYALNSCREDVQC